jgi:hypothetical protein
MDKEIRARHAAKKDWWRLERPEGSSLSGQNGRCSGEVCVAVVALTLVMAVILMVMVILGLGA